MIQFHHYFHGHRSFRYEFHCVWCGRVHRMHGHKVTKFIYLTVFLILKNNIVHLLVLWCISQSPVRREGAVVLEPTCMFLSVSLLTELQMQPPFRGRIRRKYEMTSQSSLCAHAYDVPAHTECNETHTGMAGGHRNNGEIVSYDKKLERYISE